MYHESLAKKLLDLLREWGILPPEATPRPVPVRAGGRRRRSPERR